MTTRDYAEIRAEYIAGEISLRDLAQKHGVSSSTLLHRADAEGWLAERESFRLRATSKTLEFAEQNELTARAMAGRATQQAFNDFAALPAKERGRRFPELLKLWAAMTGEVTDRNASIDETTLTDSELERIASGAGAATAQEGES